MDLPIIVLPICVYITASLLYIAPRFNEFGDDGGPAAEEWANKLAPIQKFLTLKIGEGGPNMAGHFVAASIALKGFGGLLFVFGSTMGAYLLIINLLYTIPFLYDFYNYEFGGAEFFSHLQDFLQCVALFGALLFFLGMKNSISRKQFKKKTPKSKTT